MISSIFLIYVVAQLMSTAFGLAVIDRVQTAIKTELREKGYVLKNKNSLYNFNDSIILFAKGFIPFHYAIKAINMTSDKDLIQKEFQKAINSGKYINKNEIIEEKNVEPTEDIADLSIFRAETSNHFTTERYKARRNDTTLFDTNITPIEYVVNETSKQEDLKLTPFDDENRVVEHVMVKKEVTNEDIARAISQLNVEELENLTQTIKTLTTIKRNNQQLSLKDVA